jgi:hypothetical protein
VTEHMIDVVPGLVRRQNVDGRCVYDKAACCSTIATTSASNLRVCGGSSSSVRPSTSCASRLASATSSSVAST